MIIDSQLRTPLQARALHPQPGTRIFIACATADPKKNEQLEDKGVEIIEENNGNGKVSFPDLMDHLGRMGFAHVMIEGGSRINAAALESGIVDRVLLITAPMFMGGHGARSLIEGESPSLFSDRITLTDLRIRHIGPDLIIEGRPDSRSAPLSAV